MDQLSSPCLPLEMCDHILDYLWDDHKILRSCSHVTREWLPTTRMHLFHHVRINSGSQFRRFESAILHSRNVALCVRKLELQGPFDDIDHADLRQALEALGRVEELTIRCQTLDAPNDVHRKPWPTMPMLKVLCLHSCPMERLSLQQLICVCPSLSSLKLTGSPWFKQCDESPYLYRAVQRPVSLETFHCDILFPEMMSWVFQDGVKLRMRRLAASCTPSSAFSLSTGYIHDLVEAAGERLEHLVITMRDRYSPIPLDNQQSRAALVHNPNLVSLHVLDVSCPVSYSWDSLKSILDDVQPVHAKLRSIDISLKPMNEFAATRTRWGELDAALAQVMEFRPQLVVTFWVVNDLRKPQPWLPTFVESLVHELPRVQAQRGRLALMWMNGLAEVQEFGCGLMQPSWSSC